jgi:hypothetical protein
MQLSPSELEREATRFRTALEKYLRLHPDVRLTTDFLNPWRGEFPVDCCKSTSVMFGHHLTRMVGPDRLALTNGVRGNVIHAWLRVGDYFVDLTADQFDGESRRVIVEHVEASPWFSSFAQQQSFPFDTFSQTHGSFYRSAEVAALMD